MTTKFNDLLSLTGGAAFSGASSAIGNSSLGSPYTFSVTNLSTGTFTISATETTAENIANALATLVSELKAKKIIN